MMSIIRISSTVAEESRGRPFYLGQNHDTDNKTSISIESFVYCDDSSFYCGLTPSVTSTGTMSSCKKKRRRSSFAPARKRISLSPGLGLHRQMDQSLSQEERLQELSALCMKFAVDKVSREAESEADKDQIECVKDDLYKVVDLKEHKESVYSACQQPDRLLPNPANADMDDTIKMIEKRIERLEREEADWQEYFRQLDQQIQEAESNSQNLVLHPADLTDEQKELSKDYVPDLADINIVKQQADTALNSVFVLICEHEKNLHTYQQLLVKVNKQLDKKLKRLHEQTFQNMGSPRASVQHLAEFPTPPAEPLS